MKKNLLILIAIASVLYGCKGGDNVKVTPETPTLNQIVFSSQSHAKVYTTSDAESVEVTYTDHNGGQNSVQSKADPVEVDVPFGHILEFKARGVNNSGASPGAYTDPIKALASMNEDEEVNRIEFMEAVNEMRSEGYNCSGNQMPAVPKLVWDDKLELMSVSHATDMFENNFVSGTGSDGKTYSQRIKEVFAECQSYRELLGEGPTEWSAMLQLWQNSGGCGYIMQSDMKYMAISKKGNKWVVDLRE